MEHPADSNNDGLIDTSTGPQETDRGNKGDRRKGIKGIRTIIRLGYQRCILMYHVNSSDPILFGTGFAHLPHPAQVVLRVFH
jgi:hypothetical protein